VDRRGRGAGDRTRVGRESAGKIVEDWDEYLAAKENTREGGATSVISKLDIENGYVAR
jgi:hypothetical protein